ncbi:MAG: choice-of-anchor J domain-containing protein [Candidatus Cloacimonetes bacterium]|nr:choice-of-anchor J domain-containing protein [Candidatus Cloacimonadota bacterium]
MKKLLLLSLLLILAAFAWADVYPIGDLGTYSSAMYGPFTGYYDYSWSKTIVTATEMTAAGYDGTDDMIGVGYYVGNTPSNHTMVDLHMFIRHTDLSSYTTVTDETGTAMPDSAAFTQVFSGDLTFNGGGWYYISFNLANFNWDGTSNIEIFWKNWDGDYVSGYPTWRYSNITPDYRVVYKQQDNSFPTTAGTRTTYRSNLAIVTPQMDPPNPAVLVYPTNAGWTFLDGVLSWSDGGGMPEGYDVYLDTVNGSTLVSDNQTGTSYTPTLAPGTTYYWKVIPYNANGPAANCPVWSFKTPTATQLAESFDTTPFPPTAWANPGSWSRSTITPYYGAGCAYKSASTTANILSTPLLAIDGSSVLDFWYRTSSTNGYGMLNVKYSTDRENWSQIGATIAMPTTTTWNQASVALGGIPAGNYYLAFEVSTTSSTASIYIDHVVGPEPAAIVPDPVTLTAPDNAAVDVAANPTFTWTAAAIGGVPTGYKVYCDTNANPSTQIADVATTTYTATTTLAYSTTYYWKVVAYNATGNSADSEIRSFTTLADPTIYAANLPYLQNFDSVTAPDLPPGWLSLDNNGDGDKWVTYSSNSNSSPNAAMIYTDYNTSNDDYLVTPRVELTGNQRMKFWTRAASTGEPEEISVLLSSTNPEAASFTLTAMPSTVIDFTSYAEYTVDLSAYTGFHYIAFARRNAPADGWRLYVDDVTIENIPQTAIFQIAPDLTEPWDFGLLLVGDSAEKVFRITNIGVGTLTINSITSDTNPPFSVEEIAPVDHSLAAEEYTDFKVVFTPQAAGGPYTATVTVDYGVAKAQYQIQFTGSAYAPATLPLTEGWENGQGDWFFVNGSQTNKWHIGAGDATYTPYEGNNFAYISNDGGNTVAYTINSTSVTHIYRDIAFDADCLEFPLSFQWRCVGEGTSTTYDRMRVYLVDTSVTPVAGTQLTTGQVGVDYNQQANWTAANITLPGSLSGTVKRLVFSWRNDYGSGSQPPANIDNISLTAVPIPTGPVAAPNLDYPANRQTDLPTEGFAFQFSWNTSGSEPDTYILYLANLADLDANYTSDNFFEVATPYEDVSSPFNPLITYSYSETYVWTVSGSSTAFPAEVYQWPPYEFTTLPDPTIVALPHEEYFDSVTAPALPYGWSAYINSTSTSAFVGTYSSTTYAQSPPNSVRLYNPSDASADLRLITPPIDASIPLNTIKLKFYARSGSNGYQLLIGTVDTPDGTGTFTQIASIDLTTTKTEYTYSLEDYTGTDQYICFKHGLGGTGRTLYVDNVQLSELLANDLAATLITGPSMAIVGNQVSYDITVLNNGTAAQNSYTVHLKEYGGNRLASLPVSTSLDPDATAIHTISYTFQAGDIGSMQLVGEVELLSDSNSANNESPAIPLGVYPENAWVEDFSGATMPSDWTVRSADNGSQNWTIYSTNPHSAPNCMSVRWESSSLANDDWLITPPLQLSSTQPDNISFWLGDFSSTFSETYDVMLSTTGNQIADFTVTLEAGGATGTTFSGYLYKTYNLDAYGDAVVYIAIRYTALNQLRFYADDFAGPPLYVPAEPVVTVEKVTDGVKVSWPADPYAKHYKVYMDDDPYGTFSGTPVTTTTNEYIFTGTDAKKFFKVTACTTAIPSRESNMPLLQSQMSPEEIEKSKQ